MCRRHASTNNGRDLVENDIHPKSGEYPSVQNSRSWIELHPSRILKILTILMIGCVLCFLQLRDNSEIDDTTPDDVPPADVFEKPGFYNGFMKNDNHLPVDVRKIIVGFLGEPFDLKWRGTFLFAVHPHPIDFHRTGVWYEFVAKNNEGKEIRIPYQEYTPESEWEWPDEPEMRFWDCRPLKTRGQDNADQWTSVTLKVSRLDEKRGWETWPTTTVDVPDFHDTLQEALRKDLNLPELVIPETDVEELGGYQYFHLGPAWIFMTRFYCDGDGGGSYEVVPTDGEILISDELRIDNLSLTVEYNKVNGKWEWTDQKKFVKADPSSAV
eukprot:390496_1